MPLRKKVTKNSSGCYLISLPKSWVENLSKSIGQELKEILMEVNKELVITPVFEPLKPKEETSNHE